MNQNTIDNQAEIIHNFRRCHMRGCLGVGNWYPVISLSPDNLQRAYMPFPHWLMCDHHKAIIGIDDLINGPVNDGMDSWELIQSAFRRGGRDLPQKEYCNLLWRPA